MRELHEFRIWKENLALLPDPAKARFNGIVYVLRILKDDPTFELIRTLDEKIRTGNGVGFYGYWDVSRSYTKLELSNATLFQILTTTAFEPVGEECGTVYDETAACQICGAGRIQIGPLRLKGGSVPKKDIARTIAGEIVVSERFTDAVKNVGLRGVSFGALYFGDNLSTSSFQLICSSRPIRVDKRTVAGWSVFNPSSSNDEGVEFTLAGEYPVKIEPAVVYCPLGHLIGPTLISEAYVDDSTMLAEYDFFTSRQFVGYKRGVLRPEPLYFCSPKFRKLVLSERLTGFDFEIANIDPID